NQRGAAASVEADVAQAPGLDAQRKCGPQPVAAADGLAGLWQWRLPPVTQTAFEAVLYRQPRSGGLPGASAAHRYFQCSRRRSSQPTLANSSITTITTMKINAMLSEAL